MHGLNALRGQGGMSWIEEENGWVAAPDDIVGALSRDGFDECQREMTTSRRDTRPAGGVWPGVNTRPGSVASAISVNRPIWPQPTVFITIDGESLTGAGAPSPERDPCRDDGGEG